MQDEENLLEHVKVLATAEGRAVGTAGHLRARKYLSANLRHFGLIPYNGDSYELTHDTGTEELVNVIAVAPGRNRDEPPVLIGAHYDTFGALPGADDNAAGNAILLEIGKSLVQSPAACDVVLAFFDGEELGYISKASMGSTRFYQEQYSRPVRCALILDLVGMMFQLKDSRVRCLLLAWKVAHLGPQSCEKPNQKPDCFGPQYLIHMSEA